MGDVDVRQAARIARIELTEDEVESFSRDIEEVKKVFDEIDKIDVNDEPAFQPIVVRNRVREDKAGKCFTKEETFSNTPHKEGNFFRGPKV